jgi:small conductance mechanosensitive channel
MNILPPIEEVFDAGGLTFVELLLAVLVLVVAVFVARLSRRAIRTALESRDGVEPDVAELTSRMTGWAVTLLGIVGALIVLGFQMGPVVLLLLIFAAMAAISGRKVLENFTAGLSLQMTSPFVVGDRIETAGITGWVQAITSRAVVLTSRDRRTVYIPNSTVLDSIVFNYTDDDWSRSEVAFGVAYGSDFSHVREIIVSAVTAIDSVGSDPAPVVYINELGDDGVNLIVRFYHTDSERIFARDQVAERILATLADADIALPATEIVVEQASRAPSSSKGS